MVLVKDSEEPEKEFESTTCEYYDDERCAKFCESPTILTCAATIVWDKVYERD